MVEQTRGEEELRVKETREESGVIWDCCRLLDSTTVVAGESSPEIALSPLYLRDEAEVKGIAELIAADRENFSTC